MAMTTKGATFAWSAVLVACLASSAVAGQREHVGYGADWFAAHEAIYELENRIAILEADPQVEDAYRAPVIRRTRADVSRWRAELPPARWRWVVPCCYSRRPIYIR
jgi:hypothetical protein